MQQINRCGHQKEVSGGCGGFALKKGYRNPTGFRRWVKVAKNQKL